MTDKTGKKGGARKGAGRPKGSSNKISGTTIIQAIEKYTGKSYEEQLAENYAICIREDDRPMIAKYDQMFLGKVVADKSEMDLTSGGDKLNLTINITKEELPEWGSDRS